MHPKTVILDIFAEDIFPNDEVMICLKEWLVISLSLHALNYQCTEMIYLSVAKKMRYCFKN